MRRARDTSTAIRTVKVQEPDFPDQHEIGTGKDGKERVAKALQLSSFEVSTAWLSGLLDYITIIAAQF
jgi:hypothetical protein